MRNRSRRGAVIAFASLLFVCSSRGQEMSTSTPSNDAIVHHMEELEQQVKELRAEVATLKDKDSDKSPAATTAPAATASAQSNLLANTGAAPGATPPSTPSLAGLLGPTTLSGFVD